MNTVDAEAIAEQQYILNEEDAVEPTAVLEDQCGNWHLARRRFQQLKEWTQVNGGSRRMLDITHRLMTCHPETVGMPGVQHRCKGQLCLGGKKTLYEAVG